MDALDFKLTKSCRSRSGKGSKARRRAVDAVLGILALVPGCRRLAAMKRELMVGRIAQRFGLRPESVWARLDEVRKAAKVRSEEATKADDAAIGSTDGAGRTARAGTARSAAGRPGAGGRRAEPRWPAEKSSIPGFGDCSTGLYDLLRRGRSAGPRCLRDCGLRIDPQLADYALGMQEVGRQTRGSGGVAAADTRRVPRRGERSRRAESCRTKLSAASDHDAAVELLRKLQQRVARRRFEPRRGRRSRRQVRFG